MTLDELKDAYELRLYDLKDIHCGYPGNKKSIDLPKLEAKIRRLEALIEVLEDDFYILR